MANIFQRTLGSAARQTECSANGLRFGVLFLRARWFRMPRRIRAASQQVELNYPQETGVTNDFFACFLRNEYGLRHKLPEVRTILDIGANIGFFSVAARARYPHATIHAYEPNPRAVSYLRANTSTLEIEVYSEAVGERDGYTSIVDDGDSNQARTRACDTGEIPQVGLEKAIERMGGSVDLLKLDCEGAEWDLFRAMDAWKHVRNLRMEYHLFHGETVSQVEHTLQDLGFEVIHLQPGNGFGMIWARAS
jgi:FkbM family methyltransferase